MTSDPISGAFALDETGSVSKLYCEQSTPRIENIFTLPAAYEGAAVAADAQWVYVSSNTQLGCTVFRYSLLDKSVSHRLLNTGGPCDGIATDGTAVYVALPYRSEINYLTSWEAPSHRSWDIGGAQGAETLVYDRIWKCLIVTDHHGRAFAVATSNGVVTKLATDLGVVRAVASSRQHVLLASGTKVLALARADSRVEKSPPVSLQFLTGGRISGITVDGNDRVWLNDCDKKLVEGPIPIS